MNLTTTIESGLHGVSRFIAKYISLLSPVTVFLVVILIALHRLYPPAVEWLGELVGLAKPSIASVLCLVVSVIVLERLIKLTEDLTEPRVAVFEARELAYEKVRHYINANGVAKIDLLQFSGFTAIGILSAVASKSPKADVRMLLLDPKEAECFDANTDIDHSGRISTTLGQVKELERTHPGFKVHIQHYDAPASVSSVIFDNSVCIGWYHAFPEGKIVKMRGHQAPAILAFRDEAQHLREFGQDQFEKLWNPNPCCQHH